MKKRVVVTGMGIISPVGNDIPTAWSNISNGRSGITRITKFDASNMKSQIAGEVKDFDPLKLIEPKEIKKMGEFIQYSIFAVDEALKNSGFEITEENADDVGVSIGCGIGGLPVIESNSVLLHEKGPGRISPFFIPMSIANMAAGYVSIRYGALNYNASSVSACSSSNHSIALAMNMIQYGQANMMIAGGTEGTICPMAIAGFAAMKALSTRNDEPSKASCPYDMARDGFVLSEGCGILILEEAEHAKKRGAEIYAEITGSAASSDAFHITSPSVSGQSKAMKQAVANAGINPERIDYVNTHGTSTPIGDINELSAIKDAFGVDAARKMSLSSTKSMTGHLLGGAGGIESIFTVLALYNGVIPPTINVENPDPDCDLDITPNSAKERKIDSALNNSFGFGGTNCSLVFSRFNE